MANEEASNNSQLSVSVILCTFNRCGSLTPTLNDLAASKMPPSLTWEVLVVDNNSTDQTRELAVDFCNRHPEHFRYIFEPTSGKSYALNTGIEHSRGKVLAFIDDDVEVDENWLQQITSSLHEGNWAGAGGRTLPAREFSAPVWFSEEDMGGILYGRFDFGDSPCELKSAPYGANMALRKNMLEKYGLYRTDLGPGPNPDVPRPNEDTEIGRRLMLAGEHLRYEPGAILRHPVDLSRLRKPFFLKFWFDYGRANILERSSAPVWGIDRQYVSIVKHCLLLPIELITWVLTINPQKRFKNKCRLWCTAGRISQTYRRDFQRRGPAAVPVYKGN
jgi:glucosyl-dolichyl phosphate glucuronosyltransferase